MKALGLIIAAGVSLTAAPATARTPQTVTVIVDKMAFGAVPANLHVGDTLVWKNRDLFRHSATANGQFDIDLPPNSERLMVLRRAGAFAFICKFHPGMKGVLKVSR